MGFEQEWVVQPGGKTIEILASTYYTYKIESSSIDFSDIVRSRVPGKLVTIASF